MKTRWQILFTAAIWLMASEFVFAQEGKQMVYKELSPDSFRQTLTKTPQGILLDVRTPEEYAQGHLAKAQNVDYKDDNFRSQVSKLDKSKPYFVYCKAGVRSEKAADTMKELGFKHVYALEGGIDAWKEEDLPVQKK